MSIQTFQISNPSKTVTYSTSEIIEFRFKVYKINNLNNLTYCLFLPKRSLKVDISSKYDVGVMYVLRCNRTSNSTDKS